MCSSSANLDMILFLIASPEVDLSRAGKLSDLARDADFFIKTFMHY